MPEHCPNQYVMQLAQCGKRDVGPHRLLRVHGLIAELADQVQLLLDADPCDPSETSVIDTRRKVVLIRDR